MSGGCGVDRGGGREGKNHERRVKRGLNAKVNPFDKVKATAIITLTESPVALPLSALLHPRSLIDGGCAIISRQLARDQTRMLSRATSVHVDACICFASDFDRVDELLVLVRSNPGMLFAAIGIHPDNVKRSQDKNFAAKLLQLRTLALTPECVAIFAGLDGTREIAAQYPQQKLLQDQLELGAELKLPVILHSIAAADRITELLAEFNELHTGSVAGAGGEGEEGAGGWTPKHAILAFDGDEAQLRGYLSAGCHIMLDGAVCDPVSDEGARLRSLVPLIPLHRLLIASNAPLHTPQNIGDHIIQSARNEPSTLPFLLPVITEAYNSAKGGPGGAPPLTVDALAASLHANALAFFRLSRAADTAAAPAAGAGAAVPSTASAAAAASEVGAAVVGSEEEAAACAADTSCADAESDGSSEEVDESEALDAAPASLPSEMREGNDAAAAGSSVPVSIEYRCRMCRFPLFAAEDVMAHDGLSIKPSVRTQANVRADAEADAVAAAAATTGAGSTAEDGSGKSGGRRKKQHPQQREDLSAAPPALVPAAAGPASGKQIGAVAAKAKAAPKATVAAAGGKGRKRGGRAATVDDEVEEQVAASKAAAAASKPAGKGKPAKGKRGKALRGGCGADDDSSSGDDSESLRGGAPGVRGAAQKRAPLPPPLPPAGDEDDDAGIIGSDSEGGSDSDGSPAPLPAKGSAASPAAAAAGECRKPPPRFADGATVIDTGEGLAEVAVGRWHTSRGRIVRSGGGDDAGVCRMFLVDRLPWMEEVSAAEPEGALLCPGCRTKVGLYALGGLKCSCGLAVAPGFKIPKLKVDAVLHGVDALEAALASAGLEEERGAGLGGLLLPGGTGSDGGADASAERAAKKSGLRVPVSKHKGNFSEFRNKST